MTTRKPTPKKPAPKAKAPAKQAQPKKPAAPAKKVAPVKKATPAPKKTSGPGNRPVPKRVKLQSVPGEPKRGSIWLHWCEPADFDRMLHFYMDELLRTPDYIAHPDLCAGVKADPAAWKPKLLQAAITTLQETFTGREAIKAALLLRHEGPLKEATVLGMFRVKVNPNRSGTLLDLIVAEKHRRQGYGTLLVTGVIEQLQKLNCTEVNLSTSFNNDGAEGFFRKLGLRPYSVFWAKDLPPPPPVETRLVSRQEVGGLGGRAED